MFKWRLLNGALLKLIFDLLIFVSPQLLNLLIEFMQNHNQPRWIGVAISFSMFFVAFFQSMVF